MTFCLGMNLQGGLVGIADTRVIAGNERITARKVSVFQKDRHAMFLMSARLRSARDKALIYFEENLAHSEQPLDRLFKAVNAFAAQVRRVAKEDKAALEESGFEFNLLVGIADTRVIAGNALAGSLRMTPSTVSTSSTPKATGSKSARARRITLLAPRVMGSRFLIVHCTIRTRCGLPSRSAVWPLIRPGSAR